MNAPLPLIADSLSAEQLGWGLLGLMFLLGAAHLVTTILANVAKLRERGPREQEMVTRAELNELKVTLQACATKVEITDLRVQVGSCASKSEMAVLKDALDKLDSYAHTQMHELRDALHNHGIKLEVVNQTTLTVKDSLSRTLDRLEDNSGKIERLTAILEADYRARLERQQILQSRTPQEPTA